MNEALAVGRDDRPGRAAERAGDRPVDRPVDRKGAAWIKLKLRQSIIDGVYGFGERLPAERQMAQVYASSRGTVRKALEDLADDGFIERRVGSGTFVTFSGQPADADIAEITSPMELVQVRQTVEPAMIQLAVRNATVRDISLLESAVEQLEASLDPDSFTHWDQRFHLLIAEATHNPLMVLIYRQINHVRGHAQWRAAKDKVLTPHRMQVYNEQHRAIYERIRSRDSEGSARLIHEHLAVAHSDLVIA